MVGRRTLTRLALGLLVPAMVLTKTTALFLLPAIAWMLWATSGRRIGPFLRNSLPSAALAAAVWAGYILGVVRLHFLNDYRYLFSANGYTSITFKTAASVVGASFADGLWMGHLIYPLGILASGFWLVTTFTSRLSASRTRPTAAPPPRGASSLIWALLVWMAGYLAFLAYHDNLQPRYYLVIAVPLTLLVPAVGAEALEHFGRFGLNLRSSTLFRALRATALALFSTVLVVTAASDARETLHFVRHPEYTFVNAASSLRKFVLAHPAQSPMVLSISGSNLSLMTGLPSICDDFGTMELADRVAAYHPGWYATWNQVDDDKMDALTALYHPHRVAEFPAFDDPERNLLILYRLDPVLVPRSVAHRRGLHARPLKTPGQRPSAAQLEH